MVLIAQDLDGSVFPWDEEALVRAHFFWFLPASCGLVAELPRAERLVQLGDEFNKATDGKTRADIELLADEIESNCAAPACAYLEWRGSASWNEVAIARLVRAAALAEVRRTSDGRYPESLGEDAPVDPFDPSVKVLYVPSAERTSYRVSSVGVIKPLAAHEPPRPVAAPVASKPLPAGAIARIDSESGASVASIAFTRRGEALLIATPSARLVRVVSTDGVVRLKLRAETGARPCIDGEHVLLAERDEVSRWSLADGTEIDYCDLPSQNERVAAIAPDGAMLAVAGGASNLRLFGRDGSLAQPPMQMLSEVLCLAFSRDGRFVATGMKSNSIRVYDVTTGAEYARIPPSVETLAIDFAPDGTKVVAACGKEARIADVGTKAPVGVLSTPATVNAVAWSPDGKTIATAGKDGIVRLFDVAQLEEVATFVGHSGPVTSVVFAPDGATLASAAPMGSSIFGRSPDKNARKATPSGCTSPSLGCLGCDTNVRCAHKSLEDCNGPLFAKPLFDSREWSRE